MQNFKLLCKFPHHLSSHNAISSTLELNQLPWQERERNGIGEPRAKGRFLTPCLLRASEEGHLFLSTCLTLSLKYNRMKSPNLLDLFIADIIGHIDLGTKCLVIVNSLPCLMCAPQKSCNLRGNICMENIKK